MKRTKLTRIILLMVVVITALGAGYVYKEYNRKRPSATDTSPDFSQAPGELAKSFASDIAAANAKYLNKIIAINAAVDRTEVDDNGMYTIIFKDSSTNTSVRCLMDSAENSKAALIRPAQQVQVKGTCTGYNPDDMGLGADIILQRTVIYQP
jgi:tRNA_anti-like